MTPSGYLVPNAPRIYAIGPSHPGMITRKDGSVVIVDSADQANREGRQLATFSAEAGFRLNMRLYLPTKAILNGTWKEPSGIDEGRLTATHPASGL